MKHDYKSAMSWFEHQMKKGDLRQELSTAYHALLMMQKLEEPSGEVICAGIANFSLQRSAMTSIRESLRAMLEQAEKEIEGCD